MHGLGLGRGGLCIKRDLDLGRRAAHVGGGHCHALPDLAARAVEPILAAGRAAQVQAPLRCSARMHAYPIMQHRGALYVVKTGF